MKEDRVLEKLENKALVRAHFLYLILAALSEMLLHQKTLLQEASTAVSYILFVLRVERPANQLKENSVMVQLCVILSLALPMNLK